MLAIWLLTWAQMPGRASDLSALERLAARGTGGRPPAAGVDLQVLAAVRQDSSYHRGTGDLTQLLEALGLAREEYYQATGTVDDLAVRAAQSTTPEEQARLAAEHDRAARLRGLMRDRMDHYRVGAQATTFLRNHLLTQQRARRARSLVTVLAVVAALAVVTFSWAANPEAGSPEAEPALAARPVAAVLHLSSVESVWDDRLGSPCADAARGEAGVRVVALSSDGAGVHVLVLPGEACPEPRQVTVPTDEGTVRAAVGALS